MLDQRPLLYKGRSQIVASFASKMKHLVAAAPDQALLYGSLYWTLPSQIKVLNDSKEIAATLYLSSAILAVVVIVSVALYDRLNLYSVIYGYGIPLSTSVVLIVVFFTKVSAWWGINTQSDNTQSSLCILVTCFCRLPNSISLSASYSIT